MTSCQTKRQDWYRQLRYDVMPDERHDLYSQLRYDVMPDKTSGLVQTIKQLVEVVEALEKVSGYLQ